MPPYHTVAIQEIIQETDEAIQVILHIPKSLKDLFRHKAGQYLTIKTDINGKEISRPYSICSVQNQDLSIVIKKIPNGIFSNFANSFFRDGQLLQVLPPQGKFFINIDPQNKNNYLAIAVGSGITPIMGMILSVLKNEPKSRFTLVYGNKTPEKTIFKDKLQKLEKEYEDRFSVTWCYSKAKVDGAKFGRITRDLILEVLDLHASLDLNLYLVCGPNDLKDRLLHVFSEQSIPKDRIRYELFHGDRILPKSNEKSKKTEVSKVTVIADEVTNCFSMPTNQMLLDVILENQIEVPYSCQGGVCGSCICRVVTGKLRMEKNNVLSDSDIEEGLVLACQAIPITSEVQIDFDDV